MTTQRTITTTLTATLLVSLISLSTSATARSAGDAELTHNESAARNTLVENRPLSQPKMSATTERVTLAPSESNAKAAITGSAIPAHSANVIGNATLTHNEQAAQEVISATPQHRAALAGAVAKISPQQ